MDLSSHQGPARRQSGFKHFRDMAMVLVVASWAAIPGGEAAQPETTTGQATPVLSISTPYAIPGGSVSFTVTGTPGAAVQVVTATAPAEIPRGAAGTQYFQTGTQRTVSTGTFPANGKYTFSLNIPSGATLNTIGYAQATSTLNSANLLSNSVSYRVQSAAPSGARRTLSMAVTPSGSKVYVVDKFSGVLTVVDSVNDVVQAQLPITQGFDNALPHRPIRVVVNPDGSDAYISNLTATTIPVIATSNNSVVAQIPVPVGSRGIAFDYSNGTRTLYVANEIQNAILEFVEAPLGTFTLKTTIPLVNTAPGPVLVLPNHYLAVGTRTGDTVEIVNPAAAAGSTTVAQTILAGSIHELAWSGTDILIPTFEVLGEQRVPGYNRILRMDPNSYQVTSYIIQDVGTDYRSIAVQPSTATDPLIVTAGNGTGTLIICNSAGTVLANIELSTIEVSDGYPDASPADVVIINNPTTLAPTKIYVLDLMRESLFPVELSGYVQKTEIPLAWSGQLRVPFSGIPSASDDGEWMFRDVIALGGTAFAPNPVTCNSCHMDGASDNSTLHITDGLPLQVPAPWGADQTAPYFWDGSIPTIENLVSGALKLHNHTGVPPPNGAETELLTYLTAHTPPPSIYLNTNGTMTANQIAGQTIFGNVGCPTCHMAPVFIPVAPNPLTLTQGMDGLVPANVPSLRGAWATAPYLSEGQAATLMDVFTFNPSDIHGQQTAGLTQTQLQQLVAYLQSL
jgi:DNA-binding beta-propeller fold protein YncE